MNDPVKIERKVWDIPEGFEIDKELSTKCQIVLKKIEEKKVRSWDEYCKKMKGKDSCFVDMNGNIRTTNFSYTACVGEFEDKDDAVAFAALHKLISLRKDWVGDWTPDWTNRNQPKYTIFAIRNEIVYDNICKETNHPMSFPTEEMRNEFLDTFKYLLNIAKPLL